MAISEVTVDPPGRVARLSYVEGAVSFASADAGEWTDAVLNRPLTSGDRLWLDQDARAELEVGSTTLHLDRETAFGVVKLDDGVLLVSLTEGAASIRVRTLADQETIQVETPNAAVRIRRAGEYHIEFDTDSDRTIVRARSGEAEVMGGSASHLVRASQEGVFTGLDELRAQIGPITPRTAFETWADARSRREDASVSSRYVSQRGDRLRRPRRSRRVAVRVLVRPCVAAAVSRVRLGAVSIRPLGMGQSLGLDLDRRRALGLCTVSLRPMGEPAQPLVLGARTAPRATGLCAGARRVDRQSARWLLRGGLPGPLVPARAARSVCAELSTHAAPCVPCQPVEHRDRRREDHPRLHRARPSPGLSPPCRPQSGDGRGRSRARQCPSRRHTFTGQSAAPSGPVAVRRSRCHSASASRRTRARRTSRGRPGERAAPGGGFQRAAQPRER